MTAEQRKALRPYFHGLTDEQFEEAISKYPLSNISGAMNDYTLSVIEKAVGEFRADNRQGREWGWSDGDNAAEDILSRVKSELGVE